MAILYIKLLLLYSKFCLNKWQDIYAYCFVKIDNWTTCKIKNICATGYLTPNGMVVLAGSQAVLKERSSAKEWPSVMVQRNKLIEEGGLVPEGDRFVFVKDTEFTSPSAAAAVIHGGSANGLTAWVNASGKCLKDLESQ